MLHSLLSLHFTRDSLDIESKQMKTENRLRNGKQQCEQEFHSHWEQDTQ